MNTGIRAVGTKKFLVGSLGMVVVWLFVHFIRLQGFAPTSTAMILLALPGAYALMGMLEIVAGVAFSEIGQKWDDLAGWQRGILGTAVAIIAFALVIVGMVLFAQP
jgi:hypothetical protein